MNWWLCVYIILGLIAFWFLYMLCIAIVSGAGEDLNFKMLLDKHGVKDLFDNTSGYSLDSFNFKKYGRYNTGYGELTQVGMESILGVVLDNNLNIMETVFLDIGCGVGKSLVMAKLMGFNKAIGIEIVKDRCTMARGVVKWLPDSVKNNIQVVNIDMLKWKVPQFEKPVVIFASNLLWPVEVTKDFFAKYMKAVPPGSLIISSRVYFHKGDERTTYETSVPMSWNKYDTCCVLRV